MAQELHTFIKEALDKKIPRDEIKKALRKASWQEDEIAAALASFADVNFPIAVPKRKPYLSAREAFLYLLMFLCLYLSAFSFGSLIFHFINRWIPDLLNPYHSESVRELRFAIASLIVTFPLYFYLTLRAVSAVRRDPEKKVSKVRKWLTYLTLFVAAGIIIGDLIALLTNLLGGELTLRFVLKVLTVLAIAGSIFGYYLWNFRKEEKES
ncbi:hypothetical protein A3B21_03920 [Candidatus Uhrbacteria bacterium RIFCSPLOWO2_01_FULL_47_24]|uniref:DUF5671 domain-containing protein n=1 Tax=Candidatus Uhrbacteria bacterium RIFCSPLOWO2_01_FULL_47_24 TaxID=1802401 RepID=A0A1F7UTA7_9BACT|nr:MAG: hypothetical protein A2753_00665 [Candidatus Uhrbacteria bacterium RIFCSPHIGHO2_01_FULL_47_11]OGL69118.1 MAG: hypothetical protein A3D58_02620 [Candidatus Uhrbacteria bacterium RIFCSPHIGHO2_02_FULL_46_47]OGL75729.1 MAG: hypothetical protein A3F52_02345 [Candidatus Uhrbacteria bacterium RIFCSPHIGHO2_12_FULL_47_11]OGL81489.1 MAG: hypothetical protein A3B21_03920 [Candidatus Uhrbacteria bacterium RIFCSPLOWO2_01_FULL_47_24]OGL83734.1 MAG: hypothetical protein A3J03_01375 [Candidatus Uhrbact